MWTTQQQSLYPLQFQTITDTLQQRVPCFQVQRERLLLRRVYVSSSTLCYIAVMHFNGICGSCFRKWHGSLNCSGGDFRAPQATHILLPAKPRTMSLSKHINWLAICREFWHSRKALAEGQMKAHAITNFFLSFYLDRCLQTVPPRRQPVILPVAVQLSIHSGDKIRDKNEASNILSISWIQVDINTQNKFCILRLVKVMVHNFIICISTAGNFDLLLFTS